MEEPRNFNNDVVSARASATGQSEKAKKPKKHRGKGILSFLKRKWWLVLIIVLVIGVITWLAMGYMNAKNDLNKASQTSNSGQSDVEQLTNEIGKTIKLPDEVPTLATVNDASKLSGQEFFKNAQNGDKVLIFSDAGRALLYRPSTKQVIEYSKVDLNTSSQNQ